jgi:CRISPR/Cas system-associated endoribonuclease Cas2
MKPIFIFSLKFFLWSVLVYGLFSIGFDLLFSNGVEPVKLIFEVVAFSLIFSTIMTIIQVNKVKAKGVEKITDENLAVVQEKTFVSEMNQDQVLSILKSHRILGKYKIESSDDRIQLRTAQGFRTWGEVISIKMARAGDAKFEYCVTSRPRFKTMIADDGENLQNIKLVGGILKNREAR